MKSIHSWTTLTTSLILFLPGLCWAIRCYQCGAGMEVGGEPSISCEFFPTAPRWRPFEVECPSSPPHYCAKTVTHNHEDEPIEVIRGCAPAENAFQAPNRLGCGRLSPTVLCLCDTPLCNIATAPTPLQSFPILIPLIVSTLNLIVK